MLRNGFCRQSESDVDWERPDRDIRPKDARSVFRKRRHARAKEEPRLV